MQKTRLVIITIITLLIAGNIFFAVIYFINRVELLQAQKQLNVQQTNEKSLFFAKLFIDKVLLSEGTVNFEDRLKLENAVRDINDPKIFAKWEEFTNSQNDRESQVAVGSLLKLLIVKTSQ